MLNRSRTRKRQHEHKLGVWFGFFLSTGTSESGVRSGKGKVYLFIRTRVILSFFFSFLLIYDLGPIVSFFFFFLGGEERIRIRDGRRLG
jgi:hypothetical protein